MNSFKTQLLLACSVLGLSACSGSNDNGRQIEISQQEEAARIFSSGNGDLGQVLGNGRIVTARQIAMAGINLNYNADTTELTEMTEFRVQQNANGEFTLSLNGSVWEFVEADREPNEEGEVYGYFTEAECNTTDECVSLFNYTGEIDDLKSSGNGFHEILSAQSNQVDAGQPDLRAFAVIGTETRDGDLSSLGTATYTGRARIDVYPETGFENNSGSRTRLQSNNLTMEANFGAGTISGSMDELQARGPGESDYTSIGGVLTMEETSFQVNGFAGDLSADAAFATATGATFDANSTYSGAFYGANAEEVGGVISMSGSDSDGEPFNAIGMFTADTNSD